MYEDPSGNYVRVYQVNNFMNIGTSHNVNGKMGSCRISIKGAERVICAERNDQDTQGWPNWQTMLNGWCNIDNLGVTQSNINQSTSGSNGSNGSSGLTAPNVSTGGSTGLQGISGVTNPSTQITSYSAPGIPTASTTIQSTIGQSNWAYVKQGNGQPGIDFRNLLKAREEQYGWKFAEKCDWEPMDEIWVMAKSMIQREGDSTTSTGSVNAPNGATGTSGANIAPVGSSNVAAPTGGSSSPTPATPSTPPVTGSSYNNDVSDYFINDNLAKLIVKDPLLNDLIKNRYIEYTTKLNDSYWYLAERFYQDGSLYTKIYNDNRNNVDLKNLSSNPNNIFPKNITLIIYDIDRTNKNAINNLVKASDVSSAGQNTDYVTIANATDKGYPPALITGGIAGGGADYSAAAIQSNPSDGGSGGGDQPQTTSTPDTTPNSDNATPTGAANTNTPGNIDSVTKTTSGTGQYKFNQIFFGYIDSVQKTYQAGKGGLLINIQASDHLKLLDISKVTNYPTLTPGISTNNQGIDIRWPQDQFGCFLIHEPAVNLSRQVNAATGKVDEISKGQNDGDMNRYTSFNNVFGGKDIWEIVTRLCLDAGVPASYLKKRIENVKLAPFIVQPRSGSNLLYGNLDLKTRLGVCVEAANKLFMEFFADEEGNIVLKIPNWALGANRQIANNMNKKFDPAMLQLVGFKLVSTSSAVTNQAQNAPSTTAAPSDTVGNAPSDGSSGTSPATATPDLSSGSNNTPIADAQTGVFNAQTQVNQAQTANDQAYQTYQNVQQQADAANAAVDNIQMQIINNGSTPELELQKQQLSQTADALNAQAQQEHQNCQAAVTQLAWAQTNLQTAQNTLTSVQSPGSNITAPASGSSGSGSSSTAPATPSTSTVSNATAIANAQTAVTSAQGNAAQAQTANDQAYQIYKNVQQQADAANAAVDAVQMQIINNGSTPELEQRRAQLSQTADILNAQAQQEHQNCQAAVTQLAWAQTNLQNAQTNLTSLQLSVTGSSYNDNISNVNVNLAKLIAKDPLLNNLIKNRYIEYTTKTGDCYWYLAERFYQDGSLYTKIYNDNSNLKNLLSNPNILPENTTLIIYDIDRTNISVINNLITASDVNSGGQNANGVSIANATNTVTSPVSITGTIAGAGANYSGAAIQSNTTGNVGGSNPQQTGSGTYTVQAGDTLWGIAQQFFGDGTQWQKIFNNNLGNAQAQLDPNNPNSLQIGSVLTMNSNAAAAPTPAGTATPPGNLNKLVTDHGVCLSSLTDKNIPIIPQDMILSFTLNDSDREVYNVFEVNMEMSLTNFEGLEQVRRAIPDLGSIVRFGLRPNPAVINTPLIGSVTEAIIFGIMLTCKSLANRYTGSLTMIEESSIKVGDPIRFFLYDEHPNKPVKANYDTNSTSLMFPNEKAQSVFYVTGIERSISPNGASTMTLQLKAGRMMGQESIYDICLPLYSMYYDENITIDLDKSVQDFRDYYSNKYIEYQLQPRDTIQLIILSQYGSVSPARKVEILKAIIVLNPKKFQYASGVLFNYANMNQHLFIDDKVLKIPKKDSLRV